MFKLADKNLGSCPSFLERITSAGYRVVSTVDSNDEMDKSKRKAPSRSSKSICVVLSVFIATALCITFLADYPMADSSSHALFSESQGSRKFFRENSKGEENFVPSFTLVTQIDSSMIWTIGHFCERWGGPISVALFVGTRWIEDVEPIVAKKMQTKGQCGDRLTVSYVKGTDDLTLYPVNALRNRAIAAANTTHYFIVDSDRWPSEGFYKRLNFDLRLKKLTLDPSVVLVAPSFNRRKRNCHNLKDYKEAWRRCRLRYEGKMPKTKQEMLNCVQTGFCYGIDPDMNPGQHSTGLEGWESLTHTRHVECIKSTRWEPFVVIRKDVAPSFDERFTGYGEDKISFARQLIAMGFRFHVVPDDFVCHFPHPYREWGVLWKENANNVSKRNRKHLSDFKKMLHAKYGSYKNVTELCPDSKPDFVP